MARRGPRWYFSLRSPYSWLAYRDLLDRYPDVAEEIDWLPFWEPDAATAQELAGRDIALPYVAMSREKHLYMLQDVRRLVQERGLAMAWPVDQEPVWEVSHLAYLVAEGLGRGRAFIDAAYRARWEQGRDISDPEVMAAIGRELGIDPGALAGAHTDPALRAEGIRRLELLHRDGVFGVPYFIDGFERFWGVDRLAAFAASVRSGRTGAAESLVPSLDQGHAGGCG
jgi:2-hydroxychromene-2-carboxylate isomerase